MAFDYMDKAGLSALWSKIKNRFVEKSEGKGLSDNNFTDELYNKLNSMDSVSFNDDASTFLKGDGTWGTPTISSDSIPHADYGTYGTVKYASDENIRSYFNVGYAESDVVVSNPITLSSSNTSQNSVESTDCDMVNGWVLLKPRIVVSRRSTLSTSSISPWCVIPDEDRFIVQGETGSRVFIAMTRVKINDVLKPKIFAVLDDSLSDSMIYIHNETGSNVGLASGDIITFESYISYPWGGTYTPPNLTAPESVIDGTEAIQLRQYPLLNSMDVSGVFEYSIPQTLIGNFYNYTDQSIPYSGTHLMSFYEENNKGFYIPNEGTLVCPTAGTLSVSFNCKEDGSNGHYTTVSIYINNEVADFFDTGSTTTNVNVSYEVLAGDAIRIVQTEGDNSVWWGVRILISNLKITLE